MDEKKVKILNVSKDKNGGIPCVIKNLLKFFNDSSVIYLSDSSDINVLKQYLYLKGKFKKNFKLYQLFHFHGAWTLHFLLLNQKLKKPVLVSPHGALDKTSLNKSKLKKLVAKFLFMKKAYLNADCIHALTVKEANDIKDFGIINIPIAIIPNGIDLKEEITINAVLKQKLKNIVNNRKLILSLSRLDSSKGINILIDAFERLHKADTNCVLFIVGDGSFKYTNSLKKLIISKSLQDNVYLLGKMEGDDKSTVFDMADIFISPSFNEGFGLTVIEAYRQKTPVIASTATPFEKIEELQCGWYIEPNTEEILIALQSALKLSSVELNTMGEIVYDWVEKNYSMEIINNKMDNLYRWMLSGKNKPDFII